MKTLIASVLLLTTLNVPAWDSVELSQQRIKQQQEALRAIQEKNLRENQRQQLNLERRLLNGSGDEFHQRKLLQLKEQEYYLREKMYRY